MSVVVFDMNETTLDLSPVRAVVDDVAATEGGFTVWFQKLLQLSMTMTATQTFTDFGVLAHHALVAVLATHSRELPQSSWDRVVSALRALQPYPDVEGGLVRLREAGWTLAALTNTGLESVAIQLESNGLSPLFDHVLSVDAVAAFKPAAAPYRYAADSLGVEPHDMWMVACHDWDLAGARAVGLKTAYVARPGMSYAPTYAPPDVTVADFGELADHLVWLSAVS